MSTQIEIDKKLTKYLQEIGYRSDKIIDELVAETLALGNVARMQIAPEQGQFLEIIVKISPRNCFYTSSNPCFINLIRAREISFFWMQV